MYKFTFVIKQETLERNILEFVKRAAKYGVEYTVKQSTLDESYVTLSGAHTSEIAALAGILHRDEE